MDDQRLKRELQAIVGERFVLTDPSELLPYECDGNTIFKKLPRAVVLPGNTWHFHYAKSGEYVTQITAIGPLGLEYLAGAGSKDQERG